jgi:tetratricopeptide (TPR) repeat protein
MSAQSHSVTVAKLALEADWEKIPSAARQWKETHPEDYVPDWLAGHAGLSTGDYALAAEKFSALNSRAAIQSILVFGQRLAYHNPNNSVALMLMGDALARSGMYRDALTTLDKVVDNSPQVTLLLNLRGVVHALTGDYDAAIADLDRALEYSPGFADAWANRGLVHAMQGRSQEASRDFVRALEIAPEHPAGRGAQEALHVQSRLRTLPGYVTTLGRLSAQQITNLADPVGNAWLLSNTAQRFSSQALTNAADALDRINNSVTPWLRPLSKAVEQQFSLPQAKWAPLGVQAALGFGAAGVRDFRDMHEGRFHFAMSHVLESIGNQGINAIKTGLSTWGRPTEAGRLFSVQTDLRTASYSIFPPQPRLVGVGPTAASSVLAGLPDITLAASWQIGRGSWTPNLTEIDRYALGVTKTASAFLGGVVGAATGSLWLGAAVDVSLSQGSQWLKTASQPLFDSIWMGPVRNQMIDRWRTQVYSAQAHGVQPFTFEQMFGESLMRQTGFSTADVRSLNNELTRPKYFSPPPPPPPPPQISRMNQDFLSNATNMPTQLPGGVLMNSKDLIEEARKQGQLPTLPSDVKGFLVPFLLFCANTGE